MLQNINIITNRMFLIFLVNVMCDFFVPSRTPTSYRKGTRPPRSYCHPTQPILHPLAYFLANTAAPSEFVLYTPLLYASI